MDDEQRHAWSRHCDALLWTVTTVFTTANGGLLLHVTGKPDKLLALLGMLLGVVTVYFAASFREIRTSLEQSTQDRGQFQPLRNHRLSQWPVYVLLNVCLEGFWVRLLYREYPELNYLWAVLGILSVIATVALGLLSIPDRRSGAQG